MRALRRRAAATLFLTLAAAVPLAGCGESVDRGASGTGAGSLPLDTRSPVEPPGRRMRVLVQFHRPSLAQAMRQQRFGPGRQRAYVSSLRDEAVATQSSLRAKGVTLGRPVLFARVWNGFAATVSAHDLPKLRATGLRSEPVRRFYGAGAAGGVQPARRTVTGSGGSADRRVTVALLDSGVDRSAPALAGRVKRGLDAVGHDSDPSPAGAGERHGTAIATVLAQSLGRDGGRLLSVRVAGQRRDPASGATVEYGTTDELLEGLERAVDPDGNGDVADRAPVALVGLSSPYSGFADSPEAEASAGASTLGTLIVAAAGNQGPRAGAVGTIGSPAAAPSVLAVGALGGGGAPALPALRIGLATEDGRALLGGTLLGGDARPSRARVTGLAGPSQASPRLRGRALGGSALEYFGVDAAPRARGRVVVVPARSGTARTPSLATRAAAATGAGAVALVVCEPDARRALTALPAGAASIPVVGLRGSAARRALDLTKAGGDGDGDGAAFVARPDARRDSLPLAPARSSSQGPTYALAPKPDVAAPGSSGSGTHVVAGTSVAAARVAATAARLRAGDPGATPAEIAARLVATARGHGPAAAAGAGTVDLGRAAGARVVVEPWQVALPRQDAGGRFTAVRTVTVHNLAAGSATLTPQASMRGISFAFEPDRLELRPHASAQLSITATGSGRPAGYATGELRLGAARVPVALPVGPPPPAPLSPLTLEAAGARTTGVRFSAGAARAAGPALAVEPLGRLELVIVDASGRVVRQLTPSGGALDVLPGEYAYTLTAATGRSLRSGPYRFRATAHGPGGGTPTVRTSAPFRGR